MTVRGRAVLMLIVGLAMLGLVSCGHYTCGATFGSSSCSSSGTGGSGSGVGSGVGSNGLIAFAYFVYDPVVSIGAEQLDEATSPATFAPLASFASPVLPIGLTEDGGAVVVNKSFLYIPFFNDTVYGFSIEGTTGALTPVPNSPYVVAGGGNSSAVDPTGRFLFVGDIAGNTISVFTVNATDGSLNLVQGSPFLTGGVSPKQMVTDGLGKYLYAVEGFPGSVIGAYKYDQTSGALTAVAGSPFEGAGFNMAQVAGESSGKYLVGTTLAGGNNGSDNHVYMFGITQTGNSAGALAPVAGSPFATVNAPISLTVNPNGAWIYTFSEDSLGVVQPVEGYQINTSTGALTALSGSPFTGLPAETGTFEQTGKYMFAVGGVGPTGATFGVAVYAADSSTGDLSTTLTGLGDSNHGSFVVTDAPGSPSS
jgi:6-phosphogluconolactonase (cycloisomerase 2 family)